MISTYTPIELKTTISNINFAVTMGSIYFVKLSYNEVILISYNSKLNIIDKRINMIILNIYFYGLS
jgi:hypothetical protein